MKRTYLIFILTIVLFACNNSNNTDNDNTNVEIDEIEETNEGTAFLKNSFPRLFSFYEKSDSTFDINNFDEAQVTPIDSATSYKLDASQLEDFYPYFFYNNDSSLAIDLYSYNYLITQRNEKINAEQGGPDTEVALIDVKNGTRKRIFFSGPAISLLDAKWLDNNTVLLAGVEAGEGDTNKPIILKADLTKNTFQWYIHNSKIETDVSDYVEENVFNKLN